MAKTSRNIIIEYNPKGGPIALEVLAGFATLGEFVLAFRTKDNFEFKEWGKDPKRIDDDINDIFIIPFDLAKLENYIILILGKYGPAPQGNQIKVEYLFLQDGNELQKTTIEETTAEPFLRYTHKYSFRKISK
jgi:hypothetical protein